MTPEKRPSSPRRREAAHANPNRHPDPHPPRPVAQPLAVTAQSPPPAPAEALAGLAAPRAAVPEPRAVTLDEFADYLRTVTNRDGRPYEEATIGAYVYPATYREAKSYLAGRRVLRSRTPGLICQEIWALLITYQAIRALICHAAADAGADPGRLSFTTALHAARRTLGHGTTAIQAAADEILASPLPRRPPRTCARALADPARGYPSRQGKPGPPPQRIHCTVTITTPGTATRQPHHQHKPVTSQAAKIPLNSWH